VKYLTTAEVAAIIRETEDSVRRRCATKQIRAKKLGDTWRINEDDLIEFMTGPPTRSPRKRLTARQRQQLGQSA
jgi:excisionase family DNA binding protein